MLRSASLSRRGYGWRGDEHEENTSKYTATTIRSTPFLLVSAPLSSLWFDVHETPR